MFQDDDEWIATVHYDPTVPEQYRWYVQLGMALLPTVQVSGTGSAEGRRWAVTWIPAAAASVPDRVHRSEAICVTDQGQVVLVRESGEPEWCYPGGRLEPGESPEQALVREVAEEACCSVEEFAYLGSFRVEDLDGADGHSVTMEAVYWARVRLDEWFPQHEIAERQATPWDALLQVLSCPPGAEPLVKAVLACACAAERIR